MRPLSGCRISQVWCVGFAVLHIECIMGCPYEGPCVLDEEQDMLSEIGVTSTKKLTLHTRANKFLCYLINLISDLPVCYLIIF